MRVGLSMLTLVPGLAGGSETYARGLARTLAQRATTDVTALVPSLAPDAGEGLPTTIVHSYRASQTTPGRLLAMSRAALFPARTRRELASFDIVHYPLTVPLPRPGDVRTVITLHDVQHRDLPRLFPRAQLVFRRLAYDGPVRRADAVIVPSAFVRDRAVATLQLDPSRVHVIPLGIDTHWFTPARAPRERFLLYPARPWQHKNHRLLLEAFALLRAERPGLRLVLTGAGSERLAGPEGVDARGAVPAAELLTLMRRAACLVFPSLYEGFGLPPLEAMACGTPVAASRAGSLPEVCGGAAVLFDPESPKAIAEGVASALDHAGELSARGLEHARTFSWDAAAAQHEHVYRSTQTGGG